jgi:ubiquinone/menaquinone biosynthesis C-methylase UbiE
MTTRPDGDAVAATYDLVATSYADALPDDSYEADLDRAMIADFAARVGRTAARRVLDAGCGAGRMAPVLAGRGLQYTGVDLSPAMVRTARDRHPLHHFLQGSVTALPLADASIDGVLAWYSLIHTDGDGLPAVLREFRRVLVPGGLLLLGTQSGSGHRVLSRAYGHEIALTAHLHGALLLDRLLGAEGFAVEATLVRAPRRSERHDQAIILARSASDDLAGP